MSFAGLAFSLPGFTSPPFPLHPPPPTAVFPASTGGLYPPLTPLKIHKLSLLRRPSASLDNRNNGGDGGNGNNNGGNSGKSLLLLSFFRDEHTFMDYILSCKPLLLLLVSVSSSITVSLLLASFVQGKTNNEETVYEIRGGKWFELVPDYRKDDLCMKYMWSLLLHDSESSSFVSNLWMQCKELTTELLLPEGFPESVTTDYLALLYAVGLGKGAIPTAAAVNSVLKDGIGYLSKILLSNYGRHFDVNPKSWRLFADLLENAACGLEILTPAFPHLFVPIGAIAGAGRSAASLIQAATRSCFCAGFAAQRNFAEVIAKGEAQGMVSKAIGIVLGIALANCTRSSTSLALAYFAVVTWIHMFCNLKSYQSIQLRTLNPYRASLMFSEYLLCGLVLMFSEYLLSGLVPSVKEVNDEEPLFPAAILNLKAAYEIVLKESSSPQDMLKSLFHVNYLYWLEKNAGIKSSSVANDCRPGGRLQISLEYVEREFNHVKSDGEVAGWVTDSLIARPLPNRLCLDSTAVSSVA
ncbi:unnamed protein product [Withania somnifera]